MRIHNAEKVFEIKANLREDVSRSRQWEMFKVCITSSLSAAAVSLQAAAVAATSSSSSAASAAAAASGNPA